jgi:transcriptional regulator with XRE-family HTH domain
MAIQLISRKQIGIRIGELRKGKGLSQADLAQKIEISRPSLAQIELGNRNLDVLELQKLSIALGFSLDNFLSEDFSTSQLLQSVSNVQSIESAERISTPSLQLGKFKNVLLYILEKCAGKPNVGEISLIHLLYFSDFNCYELYEEQLTGAQYFKLPHGPSPKGFENIALQLVENQYVQRVKTDYGGQMQMRYLPLIKADLQFLKASEKEIIDKVIDQMSDWSVTSIKNYTKKDMPMMATKDGEEINYELVFYRDTPYSVRNYNEEIDAL